ncbi:MAG: iron-containing redox enzyme family protein [Comamonadaceae bacterium]|nr:MAG: iron-containing redox enzyme family protein [Comamonadaceae bacterium]
MFVSAREWQRPVPENAVTRPLPSETDVPRIPARTSRAQAAANDDTPESDARALYDGLLKGSPDDATRLAARQLLQRSIASLDDADCNLPESPDGLLDWMRHSAHEANGKYRAYLEERKSGAPRRYFGNRAHALYFLRNVAPTKLVDGSWLYGLVAHWQNPRFSDLVLTYVEELGEGQPDKNHVVLYRKLLERYGLDPVDGLPESAYLQGALQLALGWNAEEFLPEVIGFNLGYEQLPLHLLITAYELNELGIDPYYFTLHITVDNDDTGHARRAVQAVHDSMPKLGDSDIADAFWQRVRDGAQLSNAGVGTTDVIAGFDIHAEVVRILAHKSAAGNGAHSDYCRVAGRSVNDWLSSPGQIPAFLAALEKAGWIKRGQPVSESRFWGLLQGERAEMFGVFSSYELQVIHDWIRGDAAADGQAFAELPAPEGRRRATFRASARLEALQHPGALGSLGEAPDDLLDPDLQSLQAFLDSKPEPQQLGRVLVNAMSPAAHWTPAGLQATRLFRQLTA